jgi:hypothetical protein
MKMSERNGMQSAFLGLGTEPTPGHANLQLTQSKDFALATSHCGRSGWRPSSQGRFPMLSYRRFRTCDCSGRHANVANNSPWAVPPFCLLGVYRNHPNIRIIGILAPRLDRKGPQAFDL